MKRTVRVTLLVDAKDDRHCDNECPYLHIFLRELRYCDVFRSKLAFNGPDTLRANQCMQGEQDAKESE